MNLIKFIKRRFKIWLLNRQIARRWDARVDLSILGNDAANAVHNMERLNDTRFIDDIVKLNKQLDEIAHTSSRLFDEIRFLVAERDHLILVKD